MCHVKLLRFLRTTWYFCRASQRTLNQLSLAIFIAKPPWSAFASILSSLSLSTLSTSRLHFLNCLDRHLISLLQQVDCRIVQISLNFPRYRSRPTTLISIGGIKLNQFRSSQGAVVESIDRFDVSIVSVTQSFNNQGSVLSKLSKSYQEN